MIIHVDCEEYKLLRGRELCLFCSVLFVFVFFNPLADFLDPQVLSIGNYDQKCNAQLQNE